MSFEESVRNLIASQQKLEREIAHLKKEAEKNNEAERRKRTRRLIQTGAMFEKHLGEIDDDYREKLEDYFSDSENFTSAGTKKSLFDIIKKRVSRS